MSKQILVCLPLREEQKRAMQQAAPEAAFRFTVPADVTAEDVRWADAVLGNVPVELIRQNDRLEWFQSNTAGPDAYLVPGVLPERCVVTNATGAYGLAISEWMLGMWLGLQKDLFLYRDRQNRSEWAPTGHSVRSVYGSRVLCRHGGHRFELCPPGARIGGRGGGRPPHGPPGHPLPRLLSAGGAPKPDGR